MAYDEGIAALVVHPADWAEVGKLRREKCVREWLEIKAVCRT
jgi:hypothetical protein